MESYAEHVKTADELRHDYPFTLEYYAEKKRITEAKLNRDSVLYLLDAVDYEKGTAEDIVSFVIENKGFFTKGETLKSQTASLNESVKDIADLVRELPVIDMAEISHLLIEAPQELQAMRKDDRYNPDDPKYDPFKEIPF